MEPYIDIQIQKNTSIDRQYLVDRVRDKKLATNVSVVYIYALVDEGVNYPNELGHVVYIGEAGRPTEPTGKRFGQHISTSETQGGDAGTIYALSRYYWGGKKLRLQVFITSDSGSRKALERELLRAHVKRFGALPICQGTTGKNYSTTSLFNIEESKEHIALFSPASNNAL